MYTKEQIAWLPTLAVGQTCDLKIEEPGRRVWLARTGVEDGEPFDNKITIELQDTAGRWYVASEYEG